MKHTKTPWEVDKKTYSTAIISGKTEICSMIYGSKLINKANAERIVKCVNAHDELVETLDCALYALEIKSSNKQFAINAVIKALKATE